MMGCLLDSRKGVSKIRTMAYTSDLFAPENAQSMAGDFESSFSSWLSTALTSNRVQRDSTVQFYEDIWSAFMAWCLAQSPQVTLDGLTEVDLQLFLESREETKQGALSSQHAWRLLSLVDHVLTHRALDGQRPKNDSAAEYIRYSDDIRRANLSDPPDLAYLDAEQVRRLVTYLSEVRPGASGQREITGWQELRNLTCVALHLGAGLTPGDARELALDAPVVSGGRWKDVPWKLKVPGNGNRPARETPVAPWAGQLIKFWLTVRSDTSLPTEPRAGPKGRALGPFLLPGRSGQLWGKMAHYEAVKQVMLAAGVDDPDNGSGGAFRLRHTFAIRQLRRKKTLEDVGRWMGIANLKEMDRYRAVLDSYEEAV
jgi:integrase